MAESAVVIQKKTLPNGYIVEIRESFRVTGTLKPQPRQFSVCIWAGQFSVLMVDQKYGMTLEEAQTEFNAVNDWRS